MAKTSLSPAPFDLSLSKGLLFFLERKGEGQGFGKLSPNGLRVGEVSG